VELLKQDQYSPLPMEMQIIQIIAGTEGVLDDIEVGSVRRFLGDLIVHFEGSAKALTAELAAKFTFKGNDLKDRIVAESRAFRSTWK
jgi:F-type H+-transporting ATPase subunit alpha